MRTMITGALVAASMLVAGSAAKAQYVPPFKGNDTGGIIAYSLTTQVDVKTLADNHCAQYGKVVRLTGVQPYYGGYLSFACIWVPPGGLSQPLRVRG